MRSAWVMKLKAGEAAAYKQKHDDIWPEMVELLISQGIHNYSIYRHGLLLFAYLERPDAAVDDNDTPDPLILKWWKWMAPHMETNPDLSPVIEPVEQMFRLD